jgi:hypothetical protein
MGFWVRLTLANRVANAASCSSSDHRRSMRKLLAERNESNRSVTEDEGPFSVVGSN